MTENVTVQLCDFHTFPNSNCLSMLKTKLRESNEIAFSMKCKPLYAITKHDITTKASDYVSLFDVEVVDDRDLLIFGNNSKLEFFNLTTRTRKRTVQLNSKVVHDIVVDGAYLYLTTGTSLEKYKLNSLLEGIEPEKAMVWDSSPSGLRDCWGLALYAMNSIKYAFVLDYARGIYVFDTKTGEKVEMTVPKIASGYGIAFTEENEMIISTSSGGAVQIYTFNNLTQSWQLLREASTSKTYKSPYGICYERKSKLIYLSDTYAKRIYVFDKQTMEVVHEWETLSEWINTSGIFSITLHQKTGHLYLPLANHSIQILN